MKATDEIVRLFREQGLRVTPQRQAIFGLLQGNGSHPTVDALFAEARTTMPTISSTSRTLASRLASSPIFQMSRPSRTIWATRRRGLSDEIGSWKIICRRGRVRRRSSPSFNTSPSRTIETASAIASRPRKR